jgi:hypothetical protein
VGAALRPVTTRWMSNVSRLRSDSHAESSDRSDQPAIAGSSLIASGPILFPQERTSL